LELILFCIVNVFSGAAAAGKGGIGGGIGLDGGFRKGLTAQACKC